ncbi:ABC transporter ATP-binding protein [Nocardiopsis dassonvillei]|uniref:ABC transporter ATP-binding protein n=1 Tax=Nocardiopsis dassonvillei TaxID=2014 RepID=UPI00366EB05B
MSETAIEVHGLRKKYGDDEAVAGVDLSVRRGEVFALLGPNGAGKSTTVEILEGFRHRDDGTVRVLGEDPGTAGRRWRSRIGVVWQGETLIPQLSVREVVRHFAGYYPAPRDPDAVVDLVGLGEKSRARVTSLSGGQRRRLDVALGIIGRPELLFLDEPTTGFDPGARRDFWTLIGDLARGGTTIVLTTHYLEEAEALADRVCVVARGRVRAQGSPATLGGRASARATVGWTVDGQRRETRTDEPARVVGELSALFSGEVPGLSVHRPTLEDVYLGLIGEEGENRGEGDDRDGRPAERRVSA